MFKRVSYLGFICFGLLGFAEELLIPGTEAFVQAFEARTKSFVYVEYTFMRELDRQNGEAVGMVVDEDGLVVLLEGVIPDWLPIDQIKEIRVFTARSEDDGYSAVYLGADPLNGWGYLRVEEKGRAELTPITQFGKTGATMGEELWGVCLTGEDLGYLPYYRFGRLSASHPLPLMTGFLTDDAAVPGGAVFNRSGVFVGWAGSALPVERDMWIGGELYRVNMRNRDETYSFLYADEFLKWMGNVPDSPIADERPWLGVSGMRPIEKDTAAFLGLEKRGAVVVSDVIADTPAAEAGIQSRDIIIGIDGEVIPHFKPDMVVQHYVERSIRSHAIGSEMRLKIIRGVEELEIVVVLGQAPKPLRAAQRKYFGGLGMTVREIVMGDAVQRRERFKEMSGIMVSFVKPNSPPSEAGLMPGDWVLAIDGKELKGIGDGLDVLELLEADVGKVEYVLLINRNNETSVLRVRRK